MRSEDFFKFMRERESIRQKKEAGEPWPWTDDVILQTYRFTNVKRAHDRTTRWFVKNWYDPNSDRPHGEILFHCAIARYFGTVEFANELGWIKNPTVDELEYIESTARKRGDRGEKVFTGAYVITNQGIAAPKEQVVVRHFLKPFLAKIPRIIKEIELTHSWRQVAIIMRDIPGFGGTGFMTKEVLQDAILTPVLTECVDINTWCPAGPGARRGLNRLYGRQVGTPMNESKALEEMKLLFRASADFIPFQDLTFPDLELHDIQFQLCEFDKYERVRHGEGKPRSLYRRPK